MFDVNFQSQATWALKTTTKIQTKPETHLTSFPSPTQLNFLSLSNKNVIWWWWTESRVIAKLRGYSLISSLRSSSCSQNRPRKISLSDENLIPLFAETCQVNCKLKLSCTLLQKPFCLSYEGFHVIAPLIAVHSNQSCRANRLLACKLRAFKQNFWFIATVDNLIWRLVTRKVKKVKARATERRPENRQQVSQSLCWQ